VRIVRIDEARREIGADRELLDVVEVRRRIDRGVRVAERGARIARGRIEREASLRAVGELRARLRRVARGHQERRAQYEQREQHEQHAEQRESSARPPCLRSVCALHR
jgi:hypothetical protein